MNPSKPSSGAEDKRIAGVCGLYCEACSWFIAAAEDPERLKRMAAQMGFPAEACRCGGCRSDMRLPYCGQCKMSACAAARGIDFCCDCDAYPCEDLKRFQAAMPHRIELWENLARIRTAGLGPWLREVRENYLCPSCGTLNSAYDLQCRACGTEPSCPYVARHRQDIEDYLRSR